jgi:phage head maturation protease
MEVRMAKKDAVILKRKHNDYMREIVNLRAEETAEKKMIVEGKAITYDDPTLLFEFGGTKVYEKIQRGAFASADLKDEPRLTYICLICLFHLYWICVY